MSSHQSNLFLKLKIIHLALLVGLLMMTVTGVIVHQIGLLPASNDELDRIFQIICVMASVGFLVIGFNLFKKKIMAARNSSEPAEGRLRQYLMASLIWWAMIELPGFIAAIGFIMTGNYAFLALAGFHILVLFLFMPRTANIIVLLQFNENDVTRLSGKE